MGEAAVAPEVKLFIAILYSPAAPVEAVFSELDGNFGQRGPTHGPVPFSWTSYYRGEMGTGLEKVYVSYTAGIRRETLPDIKLFTNSLERKYSAGDGKRLVNIDPGYVARDKVVLVTTKDFYHRLYLGNGIYGEVTLHFRRGKFRYFSWTYPDFRDPETARFLERIRAPLVKKLRERGPDAVDS